MTRKFTFLILALFALIASPGRAEVVSGTTYDTQSTTSLPNGWTGNGGGTSYIQLTSSSNHITTDKFIQNGFTSIVLKARKYNGPTDVQALITVSWYDAATSNETVLGTITPTTTSLTNYTISSPSNPTGNTSGYIKIQCKGASSNKGSGVSHVTITYTAGSSTDPSITCADITDVPYEGVTDAEANVTISNAVGWTTNVTYDGSIVTAASLYNDNTKVIYSVSENEGNTDREGSFTITLSKDGEENITKVVSVTQNHFVIDYAELPFEWVGGTSADLIALNGVTANGLGSDYAEVNAPHRVKFDTDGDYIQVKTDGQPGTVTIGTKMIGGGNTSHITIKASSDGENFDNGEQLTISGEQNDIVNLTSTRSFASNIRYVRMVFTKGSNVGVGPITISKASTTPTVAAPTFTPNGGEFIGSQEITLACTTDGATIVYTTDNWSTQTNYSEPFTITATTTVKAKATKADMNDSGIAEATYTKKYEVNYVVNGNGSAVSPSYVTPSSAIGTLPTATAPNGYTFRGWSENEVALTNVEPTYVTAGTVPEGNMTLKAVFAIEHKDIQETTSTMDFSEETYSDWIIDEDIKRTADQGTGGTGDYAGKINTNNTYITFYKKVKVESFGFSFKRTSTNENYNVYIETSTDDENWTARQTYPMNNFGNGSYTTKTDDTFDGKTDLYVRFHCNNTTANRYVDDVIIKYMGEDITYSNFCTTVNALSGTITQSNITAYTAYYISGNASISSAVEIAALGNTNASLLVIEDGAQLICNNEVAATVKKSISAINGNNGWYTIASPVKGSIDAPTAMTSSNEYDLYYYDEPEYTWRNYEYESHSSFHFQLANAQGYLYANRTATDIEFAGTLRAGNEVVGVDLSYESTYQKLKGFNLVGNPFAHNIIMGTNAIMTNKNTGYYVVENGANLVAKTFETPIKPCQGFMVQADAKGQSIIFNPGAKETQTEHEYITIAAGNGDFMDMAYICTNADEKLGKITLDNPTAKVYLQQNGNDYAIAPLGEATSMVVCFKAPASGTYTINVSSDHEGVSLKDMKTGYVTAINHSTSYTFEASENDAESRFKIMFGTTGVEENGAQMFVFQSGSNLIISGEGCVQIIDMMGRVLRTAQVESNATVSTEGLTAGAYVVRMLTANGVQTQKVIVK